MPQTLARPDYRLADNLAASDGVVFLTGTQALIRLTLMQAARDAAAGVKSQGFISGYRGSPLGMVDQQAWKAAQAARRGGREVPAGDQRGARRDRGARHAAGRVRPRAHGRRRVRHVVRQGPGRRPRRRRAQARQRLRLVAARRRARRRRRRPRLRLLVDAAPERRGDAVVAHAGGGAGERRRVPRVRPLRLGAVALLGQLGRLDRAVGDRRERLDRRPRPDERARRRLEGRRRGRGGDRLRPPRRRPALPLARPAVAEDRGAPARQARRGARLRQGQPARPPGGRVARGDGRHRHLRQGALRPARGVPPARHLARRARRGGRAALQGGPRRTRSSRRASPPSPQGCSEILVVEEKGAVVETQMRDQFYNARGAAGDRRQARRRRAGRWCPSSASCGRRG